MRPRSSTPDAKPAGAAANLVAVGLPPGQAFVDALDAAWAAGDAVAPLDPDLSPAAREVLLDELRPARQVTSTGQHPVADPVPVPASTALVVPTSGTTGTPKGVELTHAALAASVRASLERLGGTSHDRWLCCLPTHHVAGIAVILRARASGRDAVIHSRFEPDWVADEPNVTHVSLVPTQLVRLLDAGVDVERFAALLLGGAPASQELLDRARDAGANVITTYGMTETCGGCVYDGVPLDGVEAAVGTDRRVRLRGPMLFAGYRRRPDLTAAAMDDGWLVTADLGRWEGGRLVVEGRADDVIVSGGENVSGQAVTAVLRAQPTIADAVVTGEADAHWGQVVTAWLVAEPSRPQPTDEEIRAAVAARLGRAAAPRSVRWVTSLPRTGLGKVTADTLHTMRDDGDTDDAEPT